MKYWIIEEGITKFQIVVNESKPIIREITKAEYERLKKWLKEHAVEI